MIHMCQHINEFFIPCNYWKRENSNFKWYLFHPWSIIFKNKVLFVITHGILKKLSFPCIKVVNYFDACNYHSSISDFWLISTCNNRSYQAMSVLLTYNYPYHFLDLKLKIYGPFVILSEPYFIFKVDFKVRATKQNTTNGRTMFKWKRR